MPEIRVNGRAITVPDGISAAAAIFLAGETAFRTSVSGEPRAALCGMGICFECRVTLDGQLHTRSCQIVVREGMVVETW
jgi:predicted molibdopterin-dependent oxidoreductase YjgC